MIGGGLRSSTTSGACDLLRQMCLLSEDLASSALAEGALWQLLAVLVDYQAALRAKSRHHAARCTTSEQPPLAPQHSLVADILGLDLNARNTESESSEPLAKQHHTAARAAMEAMAALLQQASPAQQSFLLLGGVGVAAATIELLLQV